MTTQDAIFALLAVLVGVILLGCPVNEDDDSSDADASASGTAPVINNFQIWIGIPAGETEEMVNFAFDFTDSDSTFTI